MEYYAAGRKKEKSSYFCDNMDRTGEYYVKWNKVVGERQIPYDLTYNRNLMKKTANKQNRTTGMETWNKLTVTRRERGEVKWWKEGEGTS